MVRAVAGADQLEVVGFRVVVPGVAPGALQREVLRVAVAGSLTAPVGVVRMADARRQPDPPLRVDHRVVRVGRIVPDRLGAEVAPRLEALGGEHRRNFRVVDAQRDLDHLRAVLGGVGHRESVMGYAHGHVEPVWPQPTAESRHEESPVRAS